jgi:hypothetical protein
MPASKDSTTLGSGILHRPQGVTKRYHRLSLLRVPMLCWGMGGGGVCDVSANENSCAHHVTWSQINFEDLPPYLAYDRPPAPSLYPSLFSARRPMEPATLFCPSKLLSIFLCSETHGTSHPVLSLLASLYLSLLGDLRDLTPLPMLLFSARRLVGFFTL